MRTFYRSLLEKPIIRLATHEDYHVHIPIPSSTYHYAYARQTRVNWKKVTKKRRKKEGKERKENKKKANK